MNQDSEQKVSKAYQALNQEEPCETPPELDAAILAQANAHIEAQKAVGEPTQDNSDDKVIPLQKRRHLTLRWEAPLATAALIVLSVTVFILMPEVEQQHQLQQWQDADQFDDSVAVSDTATAELDNRSIGMMEQIAVDHEEKSASSGLTVSESLPASKPTLAAAPMPERSNQQALVSTQESEQLFADSMMRSEATARAKKKEQAREVSLARLKTMQKSTPAPQVALEDRNLSAAGYASDFSAEAELMEEAMIESASSISTEPVLEADIWKKQILDLIEQGNWKSAELEYQKFATYYPDHAFVEGYKDIKRKQSISEQTNESKK